MASIFAKLYPILFLVLIGKVYESSSKCKEKSQKCDKQVGDDTLEYLASKRPYYYNRKKAEKKRYIPEGCRPIKFWYFGRHGTRNPGKKDINAIHNLLVPLHKATKVALTAGKGRICGDARDAFNAWRLNPSLNTSVASFLVEQGERELFQIGSRYKSRFSDLFASMPRFSNMTYLFKHTDSQRTKASARSFARGIFGDEEFEEIWMPKAHKTDPVLKFYDACPKYIHEIDKNVSANAEHDLFIFSKEMNRTILKVANRLGFKSLTLDEVTTAYTACGFETAWKNGEISPWCKVFDEDDLEVMAYREDLEYYWKDGYGHYVNYEQACAPFKDALSFFESGPNMKIQAYFSHSGATLKMLARLGLFKSKKNMTATDFDDRKDDYKWKTSKIDTMATNMAFTLFDCGTEQDQIGFYFQELPTKFPGCNGKAFCPYEKFKRNIGAFVNACNLTEICSMK